ncbi:nitrate reductase [Rhodoblastus acidophilus]|nr:nitrate reductase [Rhodoblastus acidophilus]
MCAPDFFGVAYVINPWMEGQFARTDAAEARRQWLDLKALLEQRADIRLIAPRPGLPDLVFTANAGLPRNGKVVISRFRCLERRGEEEVFRDWFQRQGFEVIDPPEGLSFEGAGDALYDEARDLYWVGHGFRSHKDAAPFLEKALGTRAVSLGLIDPRFYHLDTCLCPLPGDFLLYFPGAFDPASRAAIEALVPEEQRIGVDSAEAETFCCNAVALGDKIILNAASPGLRERLAQAGLTVEATPLTQFMKAGGAAKCLTLEL